jgi:hypothetical protein
LHIQQAQHYNISAQIIQIGILLAQHMHNVLHL